MKRESDQRLIQAVITTSMTIMREFNEDEHSYAVGNETNQLANDGLEYLAGYVCFKTGHKVAEDEFNPNSWVKKVT